MSIPENNRFHKNFNPFVENEHNFYPVECITKIGFANENETDTPVSSHNDTEQCNGPSPNPPVDLVSLSAGQSPADLAPLTKFGSTLSDSLKIINKNTPEVDDEKAQFLFKKTQEFKEKFIPLLNKMDQFPSFNKATYFPNKTEKDKFTSYFQEILQEMQNFTSELDQSEPET